MKLIEICTRRRVTVCMLAALAVIFGLIGLSELKVNLLPELSYPSLTIRTEFDGAAPIEIENLISQPIEEQVGIVKGVRKVHSISRAGQSDVLLEFAWGTDMNMAGLDVREKLELIRLPLESKRPVLLRFNPSTDPILRMAMSDNRAQATDSVSTLKRLRRFSDEDLKKRLESIDGVAAVKISGGLEDEIQIQVDQERLAQFGLTVGFLTNRLSQENINLSGGDLQRGSRRFLVRTVNQFSSIDEIGDLVVTTSEGRPIYLRDVATVNQGYKERQAIIRMNGGEAVEIAIYKEGDANTVLVAERVKSRIDSLSETLPENYNIEVVEDQSIFIKQAISQVKDAAILGGILAILIIYLFLRDGMATAIIAASIPLSVLSAFFFMDAASLSLNIMSLGGLALAVGLLVDNAIVVLENIARHRSQGKHVIRAAIDGASEVGGAVTASTLTTVAVFVPLVFVQGIAGQLFKEQALTVTFALLLSLLVALLVIPMLASLVVKSPSAFPDEDFERRTPRTRVGRVVQSTRVALFSDLISLILRGLMFLGRLLRKGMMLLLKLPAAAVNLLYTSLAALYKRVLPWALQHRFIIILIAAGAMLFSWQGVQQLGSELIPQLSQGQFSIKLKMPPGTALEDTDKVVTAIETRQKEQAEIGYIYSVTGSGNRIDANPTEAGENIGDMLYVLESGSNAAVEAAVIDSARNAAERVPGLEYRVSRPALFSFSTPLEIVVSGYQLDTLKTTSLDILAALKSSDRFADLKSSLEQGQPEIKIHFDQEKVARLGSTVRDLSQQVVSKIRGDIATKYQREDRKIDVLVRNLEDDRSSFDDITNLLLDINGNTIRLGAVATVDVSDSPAEIDRIDQVRAALISANLRYGNLNEAVEEAERLLDGVVLPYGVQVRIVGQSEEMEAAFDSLFFALGLAIFLVYLVMASQFESLIHPLVIMFTVPLAGTGAVLALMLTGTPISVIVFIGLIMLVGIVVNNAIVLIDLINKLRQQGAEKRQAILEAGSSRLRPILMTTMTTVLGLLPLALGLGEGSEIRAPMAITVIGGLIFSTALTLVVIPVVYDLMDIRKTEQDAVLAGEHT